MPSLAPGAEPGRFVLRWATAWPEEGESMAFFEVTAGSLIGTVYQIWKEAVAYLRGRRGKLTRSDIVQASAKWKPQFTHQIAETKQRKLRQDVIIRDVGRLDAYPKFNETEKGISPWFRVGLVGTYHGGIQLSLGWHDLVPSAIGGYRRKGHAGETEPLPSIRAALIGFVPYEQIEHVDWEGDEFYSHPIIFCHFDAARKEPYKRLAYCERKTMDHPGGEIDWYSEIEDADRIHKATHNAGIDF